MTQLLVNPELKTLITEASKKVGVDSPRQLRRYIPDSTGSQMHHFTFERLKATEPEKLGSLIQDYILKRSKPKEVPPKRKKRRSRPGREFKGLSSSQKLRVLEALRKAGEEELANDLQIQLTDLAQLKKELKRAISHNERADQLYQAYCSAISQA